MNRFNGNWKGSMIISLIVVLVVGFFTATLLTRLDAFDGRVTNLERRLDERQKAEEELLEQLKQINAQTQELKRLEEERKKAAELHAKAVIKLKNDGFSKYEDLGEHTVALNAEDMNVLINKWTAHLKAQSVLRGHGEAFITASRETGLNPVYLLAHAIVESGAGTSYLAVNRNNFFGINAVDSNPDLAYNMGDSVDNGIIAGARWINGNFYKNGYRSLHDMQNGGYASDQKWANDIQCVANELIAMI